MVAGDGGPFNLALTSPIIPGGIVCLMIGVGRAEHGVEGMPEDDSKANEDCGAA